jgi:hypothetical protein
VGAAAEPRRRVSQAAAGRKRRWQRATSRARLSVSCCISSVDVIRAPRGRRRGSPFRSYTDRLSIHFRQNAGRKSIKSLSAESDLCACQVGPVWLGRIDASAWLMRPHTAWTNLLAPTRALPRRLKVLPAKFRPSELAPTAPATVRCRKSTWHWAGSPRRPPRVRRSRDRAESRGCAYRRPSSRGRPRPSRRSPGGRPV